MAANTKLAKVMNGEAEVTTLSARDQKKVVETLVKKNTSLSNATKAMRENAEGTATAIIGGVEMTSAAFASSMLEGYFGSDALKVGSIDVRAAGGLAAVTYGAFDLLTNKGKGGGAHAVNVGSGILSSYLASVGIQAGQALKQKGLGGVTATTKTVKAPGVAGNIAYQESEVVPGTTLMTEPAPPPEPQPSRVNRVIDHNQARRNNRRRTIVQASNSR